MRFHISVLERLQSNTFQFEDFRSVSFFVRLLSYAKLIDVFLFNAKYDRTFVTKYNQAFQSYLNAECLNNKIKANVLLKKIFILTEKDMPYIYEFRQRMDALVEKEGYNSSFTSGVWTPFTVAIQVID